MRGQFEPGTDNHAHITSDTRAEMSEKRKHVKGASKPPSGSTTEPGSPENTDTMLQKIWAKLAKLDNIETQVAKIDRIDEELKSIAGRVVTLENENVQLKKDNIELKQKVQDLEISHTFNSDVKDLRSDKADKSVLEAQEARIANLESKLVEYSNRMRRHNIVIHNLPEGYESSYMSPNSDTSTPALNADAPAFVPEGSGSAPVGASAAEDDVAGSAPDAADVAEGNVASSDKGNVTATNKHHYSMERFVETFIRKELGLDVQIDAAHRTNGTSSDKPRLIHARCLRREDRDKVLREAPSKLKSRKFKGNPVYFTDDIDPSTRDIHKKLLVKMKEMRMQGYFAYIPWTVPRVIKYKQGPRDSQQPLKTYRY